MDKVRGVPGESGAANSSWRPVLPDVARPLLSWVPGFDNAHAIRPTRKGYGGRKITWDHKHKCDKISPYEYESASRLLEDFWQEIERIMGKK